MKVRLVVLLVAALPPAWPTARADGPLEFHRVHVPAGRIDDVPLGGERHVPMPVADFEAAVARAATRSAEAGQAALAPRPLAAAARTTARLDERGWLVGTVRCDVDAAAGVVARSLPLGDLPVRSATRVASGGRREAVVFGDGDGGLALDASEAGTYLLEFALAPRVVGNGYRLPLVPALENEIDLELPADTRPVLSGAAVRDAFVAAPASGSAVWRIAFGPAAGVDIAVVPRERAPVGMAVWSRVRLGGSAAEVAASCVPDGPWRGGTEVLETSPALRIAEILAADEPLAWQASDDGRRVTITVPTWLDGRRTPVVVRGFAPAEGGAWRLPLLGPTAGGWAGGGWIVETDPAWAVAGIEPEECRVVTPETAARWPVPGLAHASRAARREAAVYVEQQGPAATVAVSVQPDVPTVDVARVTTLDISPGAVLGRSACDVQVMHGAAFEITAGVAPGWIVDAVTLVEPVGPDASGGAASRLGSAVETAPDWRVIRGAAGDVLRVGLAEAATPSRGVGLRVAGHWRGLAPGTAFGTADIDMVRFAGETAETAFIDFRLGSDAFIEVGGAPVGWMPLAGRLAALVEEGPSRGRIRAGERVPDRVARLVRRRPPLDAVVRVAVEPRDDSLVQTYAFECRAEAGGIDSFVADFSTPLGDGLEWALVAPAGTALSVRRIEPGEAARRPANVAESWLVELSPAVDGPVRVRATRTVDFSGTTAVPLAWVEGATEPGGTVAWEDAADRRLRARASGLRELAVDVRPGAVVAPVAEFAYGGAAPGLALELEPGAAGGDARAWAWRETVTCWCEESGAVESESRFALENRGRDAVALSVPAGCRLLTVVVDGVAAVDDEVAAAGGTIRVPLPAERRRVDVVARVLVPHGGSWGVQRIDPPACGIDAPVLEREVRLLLPPRLEVAATTAAWRAVDEPEETWIARLLGRVPGSVATGATAQAGFRVRRFVVDTDRDAGGILVVHTRLLAGGSILAAAAVLAFVWFRGFRSPAIVAALASGVGILALWIAPPFDGVPRIAWWTAVGGLAATLASRWAPQRWLVAARLVGLGFVAAAAGGPVSAAAAEGGWRVFVTPDDRGATALVPEPLFRLLAEASTPAAAAIRVLDCRLSVPSDSAAPWRVELGIDADAGGTLVLDQGATGATWIAPQPRPGAATVFVRAESAAGGDARRLRITAAVAGRHRVVAEVRPAGARRGDVDLAVVRLPAAPRAEVLVAGPLDPGAIGCDRAVGDGPCLPAVAADGGGGRVAFDVAGASQVRLVRPVDPRVRLVDRPRRAATVNAVEWNLGAARVETTFDLDPGPGVLAAFTVQADDRLADLAAVGADAARAQLIPLGGGAIRVELAEPVRGPVQLQLAGAVAYPSPVGVFELPTVWLAGVSEELRSVRVVAAPELDVTLDPAPAPVSTAAEFAGRPPLRVVASRRRQRPRGVQALAVVFGPDRIGLELRAQIDAGPLAFARMPVELPAGCTVDRVVLIEDDLVAGPGRPRLPVDTVWERAAPDQLVVVVQEPRAGRFRLEVDARVAARAGDRGSLPIVRAGLAGGAPLVVSWRNDADCPVDVQSAVGGGEAAATIELRDGDPVPTYEILPAAAAAASRPDVVPAEPPPPGPSRIERAETFLALDARGRVRGAVRFDLTAATADVRLRLPPGMRLFDVVVDGLDAVAEPCAADAWGVRLHDVRWPRSILALFAGELGADAVGGEPVVIEAPAIEGLPAAEMAWTIRPPQGCEVAVAPPGRRLTPEEVSAFRESRAAAVDRGFAPAVAAAGGQDLERLAALAATRRAGGSSPREADWERGLGWELEPRQAAASAAVSAGATGSLTLRIARRPDPTTPGRAGATVVLAAAGGLAWIVASRLRSDSGR